MAVIGLLLINGFTLIFLFFKKPPHGIHDHMGEHSRGHESGGPRKIIIERLHFDSTQEKSYEIIIEEHRSKMHELNEQSRNLHDELYSLLKENIIDSTKANVLIQQLSLNQKDLDKLNFDHFKKIKVICKTNQIERYNGLVDDLTILFSHEQPPK